MLVIHILTMHTLNIFLQTDQANYKYCKWLFYRFYHFCLKLMFSMWMLKFKGNLAIICYANTYITNIKTNLYIEWNLASLDTLVPCKKFRIGISRLSDHGLWKRFRVGKNYNLHDTKTLGLECVVVLEIEINWIIACWNYLHLHDNHNMVWQTLAQSQ